MLADYLVVRKRTLKIEHLYIGDSRSIYWYTSGIHWRAVLAWVLGTWPTFPGFVMTLRNPLTTSNWANLFKISFLVGSSTKLIFVSQTSLSPLCTGVSISFVSFLVICTISPPPYLGEGLNYLVSDDSVLCLGYWQGSVIRTTLSYWQTLDQTRRATLLVSMEATRREPSKGVRMIIHPLWLGPPCVAEMCV